MPQKHWHMGLADTPATSTEGAANGVYTLQQKSTGTTWSFTVAGTPNGDPDVTELENVINGISGVSGFKVVANASAINSPSVTATEDFGDFDIFQGADITAANTKQTFEGEATRLVIDPDHANFVSGANVTTNYILRNETTGTDHAFSVAGAATSHVTSAEVLTGLNAISGVGVFKASIATTLASESMIIFGPADLGKFSILQADASAAAGAVTTLGDLNKLDKALAAGGQTDDAATIQGTIELSSSKAFSVTQSDEATGAVTDPTLATGTLVNDNYFVTKAGKLDTVSNVDLRSAAKSGAAISVIDGAIEKISSMRAELGAVENRLSHTVSNLMNVAENTASARSRINDADYSVESANLAKAQVLQQAGTAMLSQANARSQLVLQLLQ
jgi:flagellin